MFLTFEEVVAITKDSAMAHQIIDAECTHIKESEGHVQKLLIEEAIRDKEAVWNGVINVATATPCDECGEPEEEEPEP
jgi:hypothetical protein